MKNKTLRTNSMKLKKVIAASLAISVLFAFTGCGNSSSTDNTNTKQESSSTTETGSADELNEKLNDLYQQENQLFADHKDAWDKAFGLMNKNAAGDAMSENYADSLASTVESNKDSFSEEEYKTLCKDIETIRGIEEEIAKLEKEIAASDSSDSSSSKSDESTAVFKAFKGKLQITCKVFNRRNVMQNLHEALLNEPFVGFSLDINQMRHCQNFIDSCITIPSPITYWNRFKHVIPHPFLYYQHTKLGESCVTKKTTRFLPQGPCQLSSMICLIFHYKQDTPFNH